MKTYRLTVSTLTSFGTPILGETLFGELCWAVAHEDGTERLAELLQGYTEGLPFMVISDAFPTGYVPLPTLPMSVWPVKSDENPKYLKKKAWLRVGEINCNPALWRDKACTEAELVRSVDAKGNHSSFWLNEVVTRNTINRAEGITGEGAFAPYLQKQIHFHPSLKWDIYAVIDETRYTKEELLRAMTSVGVFGYGRNASVGLGKFEVTAMDECFTAINYCNCMTLASSAFEGVQGILKDRTFYRVKTHFGRHGAELSISGTPFKKPVLLAQSGAVVTFDSPRTDLFIGRGVTGISRANKYTVHQGYSPVLALPEIGNV